MTKTKLNAFLLIFFVSIAIVGFMNLNKVKNQEIDFYSSASIIPITIDSISHLSGGSETEEIYAIIGYGKVDSLKSKLAVDMTTGLDINSSSLGEAKSFIGNTYDIYINPKFEYGRLKKNELTELKTKNKRDLFLWSLCFLPLISLIFYWIKKVNKN